MHTSVHPRQVLTASQTRLLTLASTVHKAQLTFPFDCMAGVKSIKSARRAAETSGPASMTAAAIRPIDGLHAHNDSAVDFW